MFDFDTLEPLIEEILASPGTDLTSISAKRVRKSLQHIDPSLTPAFLKQHREAVDKVIHRVFEKVQGGSQSEGEEPSTLQKWPQSSPDDDPKEEEEDRTDVEETPPAAKKAGKAAARRELSDAELARQLSSEINGRTRRSNSRAKPALSNGTAKKRKSKSAKSAETVVDSDDDSDAAPGKRPTKKRSTGEGGGARGGFAKPYLLSEPLAAVLGVDSLSRPQVVKQLWVYIKSNELQNPDNKREIICDSGLRPVFNVDKIDMFKMNKVLGQHLHEME